MNNLLTDGVLTLRAPEPYDAEMFAKWENDTTIWETGSSCAPFSRNLIDDYIANYNPDIFTTHQLRLMIELTATSEIVGAVDLYDFDPVNRRVGIGYIIDQEHRGKGYAAEAIGIVANYCHNRLQVKQLYAITGVDNEASIKALEAVRFKRCGRLRRWICTGANKFTDAFIFQIVF